MQIVIALYPGITHLDFTGPHQVLVRTPNVEVVVASLGGRDIAAEGLVFSQLADLAAIPSCDVLLVPGGLGAMEAMLDEAFLAEIRRLAADARYVTSVCTGSLILGAAGLLQGKRAACHWAWRELLAPFGAIVSDARVERDGRLFTGGGVTAGIDFALVLLAELAGTAYAQADPARSRVRTGPAVRGRPTGAGAAGGAGTRPRAAPTARSQGAGQRPGGRRPPAAGVRPPGVVSGR